MFRVTSVSAAGILVILLQVYQVPVRAQRPGPKPTFAYPVRYDTSESMRQVVERTSFAKKSEKNYEALTHTIPATALQRARAEMIDPIVQVSSGSLSTQVFDANFDGINNNSTTIPPDPNGAVGSNHYIQTVNSRFAVYSKTGSLLLGPADLNNLWEGFDGDWTELRKSDPVVLYDALADRWLITVIAYRIIGSQYELMAISQSGNPLGEWYRYAYEFEYIPDYQKIAIWNDGYYMSANRYYSAFGPFLGMAAYAFDRNAMLNGEEAVMIAFTGFEDHIAGHGLLPSCFDGTTPPQNTPNYFAYVVDGETQGGEDRLGIFEFQADFEDPQNSTFSGPTILTPAAFNRMCDERDCIPQPGTEHGLDMMDDRLMFRLQYRNLGAHEAMVVNHSVDAGTGRAGIRWYELRNEGSGWDIHQQGTYAPDDGHHRWMGSIAMDRFGNIALGFTVSSSTMYPSIRYTGRSANDNLGVMTFIETAVMNGTGSQASSSNRWGDYSSMAIDPSDDRTFWFTHEYYSTTSETYWRTRIAAFQLPSIIKVDQERQDGSRLTNSVVGRWDGSDFENINVPAIITPRVGYREILKAQQYHVENPNEKYHVWALNQVSQIDTVQNHRGFTINPFLTEMTSRFNYTYQNIILKNDLFETPSLTGGSILFKDPWYIDYDDQDYNNSWRNRGMQSALFHSRSVGSSGFSPDFTTKYQESPNHPYRGVFLNQRYDVPNPVSYSVSAPELQTINNIEYSAIGWYSPNPQKASLQYPNRRETGVIFHEEDAVVTARLKAHLLSTSSISPTRKNSQRKIAIQSMGSGREKIYHAVYESGERVYYVKSTNFGTDWSGEELVSYFNASSSSPSIAFAGDDLFIVYMENDKTVTKTKVTTAPAWREIDRQSLHTAMTSVPVVAAGVMEIPGDPESALALCAMVWEDGDKKLKYSVLAANGTAAKVQDPPGSGTWVSALGRDLRSGRVSGGQTQIQPRYPALVAHDGGSDVVQFGLAWNESGVLYFDDFLVHITAPNTYHVTLGVPAEIVQASAGQTILPSAAPSITLSAYQPFTQYAWYPIVSYSCTGLTSIPIGMQTMRVFGGRTFFAAAPPWYPCAVNPTEIAVRLRNIPLSFSGTPGWNVQTFASRNRCNNLSEPSISVTGELGTFLYQGVRVSSNDGVNGISVAKVTGGNQLFHVSQNYDGYDPNLPVRGYYDVQRTENLLQLFSSGASSPFSHSLSSTDQYLNKTAALVTHHVRQLMVTGDNDSTFAMYGIHLPRICDGMENEQGVEWHMAVDTTTIQEGVSLEDRMRTASFTVPSAGSMKYNVLLYGRNVGSFEESFDIVVKFLSASSGEVLLSESLAASALPDSNLYAGYIIDLSSLEGQEVYMTASLSTTPDSAFVEVIDLFITESEAEKVRSRQQEDAPRPASITLEANRPNPFGTITSIAYTLSEAGDARLAVYDLHGRLVKVLVNGPRSAGRHTFAFNASTLPSGVYIYRLDANGQTLSRRMTVVR